MSIVNHYHGEQAMKTLFGALLLVIMSFGGVRAQDAEGCKDHPLLSRMPEYFISGCSNSYNQVDVVTGIANGEHQYKTLEGNVAVLEYAYLPEKEGKLPSWFQVVKNYSNAITKIGGKKVFSDAGFGTFLLSKGGKDTWIGMELNTADAEGTNLYSYNVRVIEIEAMKQEITANEMLDELNKSGFIALYINFETGKADIKPESQVIVDQIAEMLKANASLNVSIEGHTDNVGTAASNKTLSENRAKSVMNAIVGKGIGKARLSSRGWGQEKPLADNRTEDGRAKNRRVEIVKK